MALPTAPLGQLPSMNMPYSIPRYEQPASIWEKALASFLVNAAGGAATRGVENVMSKDYATQFGEKPATGFSRLLGPNVGAEEARQRRSITAQKDMSQAEIDAANTRAQADRELKMNLDAMEGSRERYRLQQGTLDKAAAERAAAQRQADEIAANLNLVTTKQNLENNSPVSQAQAGYYRGAGDKYAADARFTESFISGQTPGVTPAGAGQAGPSPEDIAAAKALAERNKAGVAAPQETLSLEQQIQKWLSEGKSPEEIKALLSPTLTPRQQTVQSRAEQLRLRDEQRAAQTQGTVYDIMKSLNEVPITNPNDYRRLR